MKTLLLSLLLIIVSLSCAASDEIKTKLVNKYLHASKHEQLLIEFDKSYTTEAKRLHPYLPKSFWSSNEYKTIINEYNKNLWAGWEKTYYNHLTKKELKELLNFLDTDLGQKFLRMQLELDPVYTEVTNKSVAILNDKFGHLIYEHKNR